MSAGLPANQQQLAPTSQLTPTLYDVSAPLYVGHHILGPGRPGPGVGIIGLGGMSTLPPVVGVGMPIGLNHMGGMSHPVTTLCPTTCFVHVLLMSAVEYCRTFHIFIDSPHV